MGFSLGIVDSDKLAGECIKHSSSALPYVNTLVKVLKKEFKLGRIDRYSYERQINILTVIQLELEHIQNVAKESVQGLGAVIDVKI